MNESAIAIIGGSFLFLLGIIQALFFWILNKLDKRVESIALEVSGVRTNYIAQFKDVRDSLFNTEKRIVDKIENLFNTIDEKYARK